MKLNRAAVFLALGLGTATGAPGDVPPPPQGPDEREVEGIDPVEENLQSLIDAERSFAATSVERGMKTAFLGSLRDDAILVRPGPVNGKQVWKKRPESRAQLAWAPSFAEVSGFGDLGFTSGPWEFRARPDTAASAFGPMNPSKKSSA